MSLAHTAHAGTDPAELRRWYEAYRRRQARRLLDLLPRDAVRPLYRAAATAAADAPEDPLERLLAYCADLLPLPPFGVWMEDLTRNPDAHVADWDDSVEVPTVGEPATLAARALRRGAERWTVRLRAYMDQGAWRAYLAFRGPVLADEHHTAVVFHEASAGALRDRFQDFDDRTLEGFLRSCLP